MSQTPIPKTNVFEEMASKFKITATLNYQCLCEDFEQFVKEIDKPIYEDIESFSLKILQDRFQFYNTLIQTESSDSPNKSEFEIQKLNDVEDRMSHQKISTKPKEQFRPEILPHSLEYRVKPDSESIIGDKTKPQSVAETKTPKTAKFETKDVPPKNSLHSIVQKNGKEIIPPNLYDPNQESGGQGLAAYFPLLAQRLKEKYQKKKLKEQSSNTLEPEQLRNSEDFNSAFAESHSVQEPKKHEKPGLLSTSRKDPPGNSPSKPQTVPKEVLSPRKRSRTDNLDGSPSTKIVTTDQPAKKVFIRSPPPLLPFEGLAVRLQSVASHNLASQTENTNARNNSVKFFEFCKKQWECGAEPHIDPKQYTKCESELFEILFNIFRQLIYSTVFVHVILEDLDETKLDISKFLSNLAGKDFYEEAKNLKIFTEEGQKIPTLENEDVRVQLNQCLRKMIYFVRFTTAYVNNILISCGLENLSDLKEAIKRLHLISGYLIADGYTKEIGLIKIRVDLTSEIYEHYQDLMPQITYMSQLEDYLKNCYLYLGYFLEKILDILKES